MTKPFSYEDAIAPAAPASAGFSYEDAIGEPKKPEKAPGLARGAADTAIAGATGLVSGVQMLSNVAGADNPVSRGLGKANEFLTDLESSYRKAEKQERAKKIKAAEESGSTWEEVKAYAGAFGEAPLDTTVNALGTSVPTLAAAFLTGGKSAAAQIAARALPAAMGAAQGAGAVKGQIYEAVEQEHLNAGKSPEEAAARAAEAQAYTGDNAAQIGLGAGLGVLAGTTGAEAAVRRLVGGTVAKEAGKEAAMGIGKAAGLGVLKETPVEMLQGGQERVASNLALQNEGFDTPTWQGVAGQAALEGLASAPMGAGFGMLDARGLPTVNPNTAVEPPAQPPAPAGLPQELAGNQAIAQIAQSVEPLGIVPDPTAPPNPKLPKLGGWTDANLKTTLDYQIQKGDKANKALTQGLANELARRAVNPYTPDAPIPLSGEVPPVAIPPEPVKPSEAMGIDPNAGAISRVAAAAVDGPASMEMAAQQANAAIAVEDNPEAGAPADQPAIEAPAQPQGAANVSNTDAAGALAAGTGGRVGADAAGGGPDAGLLETDAEQRPAGTAAAPGPVVQEGDAAPVPGRDSDPALTKGPINTKAKVGGLKELIARNKAAKANVQDQPQGTSPAAAPAPAEAVQAPQAVGSDGAAQPGAAPAGNAGVEAAGVGAPALAKREDGTLKNKSEYTADEWSAYTKSVIDAKLGQQAATPSPTTTEPTNAPRSPEAAQAVETTPQGREEAALLSDSVSTEPNLEAAKALLARQKAATGNAVAEGKLRKELRDLAAKTPETDTKTVLALDTAATRLGMGEGKLKGLEFMPAESSRLKRDLSGPAPAAAPAVAAPAPDNKIDPAVRERLMAIAKRLGVAVNTANGGFKAGGGAVDIPAEDAQVEGALSPNHVAAHELGHAAMQKRSMSFQGHPIGKIKETFIPNWDDLVAASKAFRPAVWASESLRIKNHARKPNEVIADAIGSVYLGLNDVSLLEPMMKRTGTTVFDLGLEDAPAPTQQAQAPAEPSAAPAPALQPTVAQATHQDPGEKPEAATKGVVNDSLKTAAKNEDTKPSEMRKWLLAEIDKELLQAPDRADYDEAVKRLGEKDAISMYTGNGFLGKNAETGFITFDVPGDGKFKVRNSVRGLLEFRKTVNSSLGFKDGGQKTLKPEQNDGVQGGSGGQMAAVTNMIEEGDFEAARDYAEAVGIKLEDVKVPRGERKPQWDQFLKDGTVPPPPNTAPLPEKKTADQLNAEKLEAEEAERRRPKDTGWNMAGTGYGGKRYTGRNITLADGREVVARIYENAGNYDEVEIKVDGARKFAVRDSFNAQDKADAFIRTLSATGEKITDKLATPDKMTPRQFDGWIRQRATIQTEQFRGDRNHGGGDEGVGYIHLSGKVEAGGTNWAGTARGNQDKRDTRLIFRTDDNKIVWYDDASQQVYEVLKDDARLEITRPEPTPKQARDPQEITVTVDGSDYTVTFDEPLATISNQAFQDNLDEYGTPGVAKAEFRKLRAQAQAGGAATSAATGTRRDPAKVSMFNPYNDGDIVTIDGQDWTVKADTPGWYLTTTGNWRGQHPTIRNVKAMADLIREVEQAAEAKPASAGRTYQSAYDAEVERMHELADKKGVPASGINDDLSASLASLTIGRGFNQSPDEFLSANPAQKGRRDAMVAWRNGQIDHKPGQSEWAKRREKAQPAAESDAPKLTQAEAKDLMEWQDLGQKDGIKTHILTFYESKADKDAKRGRMTVATVSKEVDSKTWVLESNGEKYAMLGFAKKRAEEAGMAKAVADGFVEPAATPMSKYDDEARAYGYQVAPDGKISKGDKALSPVVKEVRGRLRVEAPDGKLLFSGATTPEAFGEFLRSFWGAEKTAQPTNDRDTFTLERLNPETDRMEPVTFQRGETVKIAAGQRPYPTGVITGISHAERKFRVDGNDYGHDFGYAYKADFDELAQPRQEVDASLNTLEQRLNEGNAIQSEGFIRSAKEVIERNNLGDYAKDRMAQLARRAADVSKSVLDKMRAAKAEKEQADAQKRAEDQAKAAEPKPPIEMTMDEWKAVSKDFKGMIDGKRTVMRDGGMRFVTIIPSKAAESKTPTIDAHNATMAAVREGKATAEQFKASFEAVVAGKEAIKAELDTMTKVQLLREGGPFVQMRYANEKKGEVVDAVYRQLVGEYALGETVSYGMGKGAYEAAIRRMVEAADDAKLAAYAVERKAAMEEAQASRAARAAAIENPQTLSDYREAINVKVREGMTRKEAFLTLTPEQRINYDTLEAEGTREAREARKRALKTQVRAADQTTGGQIIATKHTKNGYDLFVVQLSDRLSREDYQTVLASAKKLGGWYSAFRGNGAVPGFQFKDKANAEAFLKLAGGDTSAAEEQAAQRRDAFEDDRSQTAVERLRAMADKLEAQAAEVEGRERKTNTARRARFASAALNAAAADKAKAKTMRNIADGIEAGRAKFLDEVRTKSQVDMLAGIVETAKGNELRAKYPSYADQEKRKGEPPTAETADFAEFPSYSAFRSDLATLGRQLLEVDGTKKLGQRLMSVADDVTDAYLEFAKANFRDVSQFGRGDSLADFASKDEAERAIKRSGLTGKAIVLPIKRGQNRVILSPSEAIGRGVWQGDGDKRITLTVDFGNELVEAIGRRGNKANKLSVPWQFQNAYDRRKALARIGIETPSEFRSALREFIDLKEQAVANRTRELELQMVGRKADGLDFFPTSAEVADQMVEAADLSPDMAVLEPSAGMGHLADRIREAGAEPDVIEISPDRRELLEEKGYHLADVDDFMQMEPRKFFTYGDVFRAPDGTEGIMRGGNSSMGSDRVMLVGEDGRGVGAGFYNRSELVGVRHRGSESGYDRIIMNPPFSNRRDAEHVRHAYDLLKPGGRIVAIMGEGVFFGQDKKAQDFREWLDSVGGTSEKLPEGSFMDPSLPVNTGVNARMVVIDKPAAGTTDAVFSQGLLSPASSGPKPTSDQIQRLVDKMQQVAKNALPVTVTASPSDITGLKVPAGSKPTGALIGGRIYLFADNLKSTGDAYVTLFHELFHLGMQKVIPAEDYAAMLAKFSKNLLVQRFVREWKASPEGVEKASTMPAAAYDALAAEEALAMVSEELAANNGIGTRNMPGLAKSMLSWLSSVADRLGFPPAFSDWMRGLTRTDAEKFVSDMVRAAMGGEKYLGATRTKYGTELAQMTEQSRLSAGDAGSPDIRFRATPRELAGMATEQLNTALKSVTITSIKQAAGYKATDLMGIALGGLGRRQLVEIYGKDLPLDKYNELATQMEADKNEYGAEADTIATEWGKLKDEGALANIMHDATLAKIDPDKPLQPGDDPAAYNALKMRFSLMSKEAKETYRKARDGYKRHHANVREAIKERIERSQMSPERRAALVERMDSEFFAAMKGVYFPLARFGKYVVVVRGADGKVETVARSETMAEAAALRRNLVAGFPAAKGYQVDKVILSREFVASRDAVGRGFMQELYQVLDKQDMDPAMRAEMEDTLGQLYLSSLPDVSWAKHGIHRKGTPGFSQDARRAFAQNMFHGARYLAKLRYSDLMQTELKAMQDHVDKIGNVLPEEDGFNGPRMQRVVDEFYKRHDSLMNPNSHPLSTALTSIGFMFHLGLSPASALVNMTQTALVAYPIMGARWGFGKAGAALLKASKQAAMGRNDITKFLNRDERRAYDQAVKDGTIDVTQAHDLAGIAQGEDAGVMWRIRPAMRAASFLFHHAERFNRQATFVAAYRLAREAGTTHEAAFEQATKATYDGHYDYSAGNRPRFMQGNAAKVILLFKSYAQNMVYTLARNAYQSANALDPKERAEARKALAGILATHAMAAGVLGLPMVTTILAAISAAGSDDDEPFDAQVALQNMLADTFGQKPAEVITRGLSRLGPWDISGRVGLDRLIFPDVQEGLEGQRLAESAAFAALGPVAGIGLNILKGIQEIGDGHMLRGITTMMPAALRGPLNAVRLSNEGAQDKTGIPIVDEVDAASVFGQALGFSPSVVRQATEGKRAVLSYDRALNERRQELMTQYARGAMKQDAEAMQEARDAIQAFNEKNPGRRITMMQLHQSVRNRERRIDQADNGVYLPKNRREAMDQGRFALTE